MMMMPKLFKAIVLMAAIASFTACGKPKTQSGNPVQGEVTTEEGATEAKNVLDRIKEEGKIIIGISDDYPPFSFAEGEGEDSKYAGLEVDIARYLALELIGEEALIEFVPLKTEERIEKLDAGEVDVLITSLSQTEERKQQIAFSEAYYSSGVGLLIPKYSSEIKAWSDLKEKTVCTLGKSVYAGELEKLGMVILEVENSEGMLSALKDKKCVGGAMEEAAIAGLVRNSDWSDYNNSRLPTLFPTPWGMGMRRGPDSESLLEAVNLAIIQMEAEGFIVQKEEEWKIPPTDYVKERMELAKSVIAAQPKKDEKKEEEESFLSGYLAIADGSSSILPVTLALSETFEEANKGVRVGVGGTGVTQGFEQFCAGEIDIVHSARPINKDEMKVCRKERHRYLEMPFAFDAIAVVANPKNTWATCLKREELKKIWSTEASGKIENWQDIRKEFSDSPLVLSAPPSDSGTSEYFLEAILGKGEGVEGRVDYNAQADEALIVQSTTAEEGGLGILGISTYEENKDVLKIIAVENEAGKCVEPSRKTIDNGTYSPLSRPLFFYVSEEALEANPAVKEFAKFLINPENQSAIAKFGYVPVSGDLLERVRTRLSNGVTGTLFAGGSSVGVNLSDMLLGARTTEIPEGKENENDG